MNNYRRQQISTISNADFPTFEINGYHVRAVTPYACKEIKDILNL